MRVIVRVTDIFLRSNNAWFRILYHGEKTIFTSVSLSKEANPLENSIKSDDEKKLVRKKQQVKWHKTNLALFGPIIKEKKVKKKVSNELVEKPKKEIGAQIIPLPISLWNGSSVQIKLGKKGNYMVKEEKTKLGDKIELPLTDVIITTSTITKEPNQTDGDIPKNPKKERRTKKTIETLDVASPAILQTTTIVETDFEKKLKIVNQDLSDFKSITDVLPTTPFFVKDDIILPFPMVLKKHSHDVSGTKEIVTIASAKVDAPSVTQVLKKTMSDKSEMMLALWRKRKIAEVGEEGLKDFMRESKMTGKELHTSIETYLRGVEYTNVRVEPRISGHWLSMKSILGSLEDVLVLESYVVHPHLKYKGFVDCVARHKDNLVVIEWKTSQRTKATLEEAYDDPVQIAAYVGALNADDKYPFEVQNALLVVAYPTGRPADVLTLDRDKCEHYWNQWLKRLEAFNHLKGCSEKE